MKYNKGKKRWEWATKMPSYPHLVLENYYAHFDRRYFGGFDWFRLGFWFFVPVLDFWVGRGSIGLSLFGFSLQLRRW